MKHQRGVILISALILVALATIISATLFFETAMAARRAKGNFMLEEAVQLAQGAEALAAYMLSDSEDNNQEDSMTDSWTIPYGPREIEPGIEMAAQLTDEQAKFNINTLVKADGSRNEDAFKVFVRLLELSGVETTWASLVLDWIDPDNTPQSDGGEDSLYTAQQPPHLTANVLITSTSELLQIPNLTQEIYRKIAPHISALPPTANQVNVCLADGIVLDALFALSTSRPGYIEHSRRSKEDMAKLREGGCFPRKKDLTDIDQKLGSLTRESTSYFRLETMIRIGTAEFTLYSLMYRDPRKRARSVARTLGTL
jgi:general secretion pathway protein K